MRTYVTISEFSRDRGVTRQSVHEWVRRYEIPLVDGKLDLEVARIQWGTNRMRRPAPQAQHTASDSPPVLALVARLVPAAATEFVRGSPGPAVALLRAALAQVPGELRPAVALPFDVAHALVADVLAVVREFEPVADEPRALSDDDAVELAPFWYAVAAGEVVVSGSTQ